MLARIALLLWMLCGGAAYAADVDAPDGLDDSAFAALPIQHAGRIKPLNSFATITLQQFHGATRIGDQSPTQWLAETLFDPASAVDEPLFLLKDTDAQAMLHLPPHADHFYSFSEVAQAFGEHQAIIEPLLKQPEAERSPEQGAVVTLYENTQLFSQLTLSMTPYLPMSLTLDDATRARLKMPNNNAAFIENYRYLPAMQAALRSIIARKGTDLAHYTPSEMQLAASAQKLSMTLESGRENTLFRVIPPAWGGDAWLSPWALFNAGQGAPQTVAITQGWRDLAAAYREHDALKWRTLSTTLRDTMNATPGLRPAALALEIAYYRTAPLSKAMALYIAGFILTLFYVSGLEPWRKRLGIAALASTAIGAALHVASIAARVFILERPPVGTLYESLIFVSLIAVVFGLFLAIRLRTALGLFVATLAGSLLIFVSGSFAGDDTMTMLIAVLNTNFWLATHVLCITTGYGFGLVAGIIAHGYLIVAIRNRHPESARPLFRSAYATALIALLFTALGTILGGIWADQSWGRFWGWDPKENGALMICLWLIWLLHSRITQHMGERGFAAGLALVNIVIALSWLGVNLLSTGLHSYGFTDKAAWSLAAFCSVEIIFVATAYGLLWRREHAQRI